jgi:alkanesulfonate monooxygenase SsuD/methylene tetrahydromethanopterin reductase-like flavin-dependent oxidoreductase (luciferase family)
MYIIMNVMSINPQLVEGFYAEEIDLGMNMQTSTLKFDETGESLHIQQASQIRAFRAAWKEARHTRTPRISISRSIFPLIDDRDHAHFGRVGQEDDKIGFLDENTRAIFGRSYAAEPDILVEQLRNEEAIADADTLLLGTTAEAGEAFIADAESDQAGSSR